MTMPALLPYRPIDDLPGVPGSARFIMAAVEPDLWSALWEELHQERLKHGTPNGERFSLLLERARRRVQRRENGRRVISLSWEEVRPSAWTSQQSVEVLAVGHLCGCCLLQHLHRQRPMLAQIVWRRWQGYTQADIAAEFGISQSQVSRLLSQAQDLIQEWLDG
jgi:hypothetical protein